LGALGGVEQGNSWLRLGELRLQSALGGPAPATACGSNTQGRTRNSEIALLRPRALCYFEAVEVVLRKVGRKPGRAVVGRLLRAPRKGAVVVIEFPDGLHEYVTTPVKRILRLAGREIYYLQTANSRYRLEVRSDSAPLAEAPAVH